MTTAFVLAGGASLGAIQAGMVDALAEAGIQPDLIVGTSVGAINGAWLAGNPWPACAPTLGDLWRSVRRRDIFPISPLRLARGLMGLTDHTVSNGPLSRWMSVRAPVYRLEQTILPLHVVATDLLRGSPVVLSSGDAIDCLLASAAIPGVFPPVEIDGRWLVDGGLSANTPVSQAIDLGADVVYLMPTVNDAPGGRPKGALGVSMQAVTHLLGHASKSEIRATASRCTLYVVPPPDSIGVAPYDFTHGQELMDLARSRTRSWLATCQPVPAL